MSADAIGHTLSGVRVQRVVVAASPQIIKRGRGWRRGLCKRVVSPQGKRLTMICASLALLHPLLSLTHWIFRSLMLPYKSSSHSANHVCCASLRSESKETRKLAVFPWICKALKLPRIESCPFDSYIPNFYLLSSLSDTELPIFSSTESVLSRAISSWSQKAFFSSLAGCQTFGA